MEISLKFDLKINFSSFHRVGLIMVKFILWEQTHCANVPIVGAKIMMKGPHCLLERLTQRELLRANEMLLKCTLFQEEG